MTDYTELQKAAEYAAQDVAKFADEDEESRAFQQFHEEVSPETVLALIAENERLQQREQDLSASVKYWFNACGGKQFESGVKHADEAASKYIDEHWRQQRDQLKHSLDAIDKELRGNVNDPDPLTRSFHDAVSCSTTYGLVAGIRRERDQIRAEIAGLKTGYEAYERVNAELKAEVEKLRKERDARQPFKPFHEPSIGYTGCVICGMYTDHGGLPCPKTRATADAALGRGEQS
jgi:cell division protein FtsB